MLLETQEFVKALGIIVIFGFLLGTGLQRVATRYDLSLR